jgi:hypothetical protein
MSAKPHDAADHDAIGKYVKVVIVPPACWAACLLTRA